MHDLPYQPNVPVKTESILRHFRSQEMHIVPGLAVVIKIPPAKTQDETFDELACSEEDQASITEIVKTIAENGKLSLLFKQNHLRYVGAQINHVHPLKFLATVFTNTELTGCMRDIFDDYFKRTGFIDGLGPSLSREMEKGKLDQYIEDFASRLGISADDIRPYFQSADWEALVRHLIGE